MNSDLPRRPYPMAVPPPGGFEDAVRRGRHRRRKQTGSGAALALVLVGALGWSMLARPNGADRLDPAKPPRTTATSRPGPDGGHQSTGPSADPGSGGQPSGTTPGSGGGTQPTGSISHPGGTGSTRPVRPVAGRAFARRSAITPGHQSQTTECLGNSTSWCAFAGLTGAGPYVLAISVCRSATQPAADLVFDLDEEVDFSALDNVQNDTVWTWSRGQAVHEASITIQVSPGDCYTWSTAWDGFDDFGDTPAQGPYTLRGRLLTTNVTIPITPYGFDHF